MKTGKGLLALCLALLLALGTLCACGRGEESPLRSDSLYVRPVENLPEDFILGMDASCVPALEAGGVRYYDHEGREKDVYQILAENGINYIRVRVWNDPYTAEGKGYGGGNCDLANAVTIGKRAAEYGLKLLVNFHYSDFWADPAKQMAPKAWQGMSVDEKSRALYEYTADALQQLTEAGAEVGMVQIGNETNGAFCGESSSSLGGWKKIAQLMNAGAKAVREHCPEAKIAIHFANPEKVSNYESYSANLDYYQVDYDVFASSYYPFWHGTLDNLAQVLSKVAEQYGKEVMVAETSYAFTAEDTDFYGNTIGDGGGIVRDYPFTQQGQANLVRDVVDTVANKTLGGIGVFYWEGTWISAGGADYEANRSLWQQYGSGWATSWAGEYDPEDAGQWYGGCAVDNQAFFDAGGKATEALKVFGLLRQGNAVENSADALEEPQLIFDLNGPLQLPETVNAIMKDNSRQAIPVQWDPVQVAALRNDAVARYTVSGTAGSMTARCHISVVEYNYLSNGSFEQGEEGWTARALKSFDELGIEDKVSDSLTGTKHYHFWGAAANAVEFTLEQQLQQLPAGRYRFTVSLMGGDGGETEIYAYVKRNGELVATAETDITVYNEWHTAAVSPVDCGAGDSLTVGVYVKCAGPNAWGKIDDAALHSVKEG